MSTSDSTQPGIREIPKDSFVLLPLLIWPVWLTQVEDVLYGEILRWSRNPQSWQFDEHLTLSATTAMLIVALLYSARAWAQRRWWIAGATTALGVITVSAALLGAVAEAARGTPANEFSSENRSELDYAMDRLRSARRRGTVPPTVTVGLSELDVLYAEGSLLVLGRPRTLLRRAVPLQAGSRDDLSDYWIGSSTVSQMLIPKEFPALKARVLDVLNAHGGLLVLEGQHLPSGRVRYSDLSEMNRYLTWRYPDHLVYLAVLSEPVIAERVDARTLRLSVPADTAYEQIGVKETRLLVEASYSRSYQLYAPDALLKELVNYGPSRALDNLTRRPETYANALRLIFGLDVQQSALKKAGACWMTSRSACE